MSNAENRTHGGKGVNVPSAAAFNATPSTPATVKGGVFVYCAKQRKMVEKFSPEGQERVNAPTVRREIRAFLSPIDGSVVSTRRELAAHNKRHGVTNASDYSEGYVKGRAHERVEKGERHLKDTRRSDINHAINRYT